jgi:hypothetical protein
MTHRDNENRCCEITGNRLCENLATRLVCGVGIRCIDHDGGAGPGNTVVSSDADDSTRRTVRENPFPSLADLVTHPLELE